MNSLYKRFVTMCMISISALLAWIYCLFEFRDKPIYIAIISLVLVVSVYALFMAAYNIKVSKDSQMEQYISNTLSSMLSSISKNDNEELERLSKALYVQLRKSNTILSQMAEDHNASSNNTQNLISESINKAVKLSVKYNQLNNNKLIESSTEVSNELTNTYKDLVSTLNKLNAELIVLRNTAPSNVPFDNAEVPSSLNSLDIFNENDNDFSNEPEKDEADVIPFPVSEPAEDIEPIAEPEPAINETFDPNKPMSPEEIAALFASMESTSEPTPEPEPEPAPADVDPNRPMSPEEIAALFASMDASNEPAPEPEPEPTPEPVDPNKPLSPEEIAALFASMQ